MMKRSDENKPWIVRLKCKPLYAASVACALLLLSFFAIVGCGPLLTTDPQSGVPYEGSKTDAYEVFLWHNKC